MNHNIKGVRHIKPAFFLDPELSLKQHSFITSWLYAVIDKKSILAPLVGRGDVETNLKDICLQEPLASPQGEILMFCDMHVSLKKPNRGFDEIFIEVFVNPSADAILQRVKYMERLVNKDNAVYCVCGPEMNPEPFLNESINYIDSTNKRLFMAF